MLFNHFTRSLKLLHRVLPHCPSYIDQSVLPNKLLNQQFRAMSNLTRDEIVDDSEPEREEIRRRERNAKRLMSPRRARKLLISQGVIEIFDDDPDSPVRIPQQDLNLTSNDNALTCNPSSPPFALPSLVDPTSITSAPVEGPRRAQVHPLLLRRGGYNATSSNDAHSDDELKLNVARFAYTCSPKSGPSRAGSGLSNTTTKDKPAPKKRLPASHQFSFDFSDEELSKLKRCVSCEVNWTTRKTGSQKILHIQSCGKKNAFTDETIRILIRKEIDTVVGIKGTDKVTYALPMQRTFFEDIVTDATRKKKGRHVGVIETVQSVPTAHNVILDQARAVLGSPIHAKSNDELRMLHTQSIGGKHSNDDDPLPATQVFGRSALGQTNLHSSKSILSWSEGHLDTDATSSAQNFAPSKLGRIMHDVPILAQSDLINRPHIGGRSPLLNADPFAGSQNSVRDLGPSQIARNDDDRVFSPHFRGVSLEGVSDTCANKHLDDVDGSINGWHNDDAYLHFEPKMDGSILHRDAQYQINPSTNGAVTSRKQKRSSFQKSGPAAGDVNLPRLTPRRTPKKTKDKQEEYDDINWEATMKERLIQDRNLHLRILRYEPVHFDIFLRLASGESTNAGKFKMRLRSFLDKQSINFYGADPAGRK